jgi:hypothetical protein
MLDCGRFERTTFQQAAAPADEAGILGNGRNRFHEAPIAGCNREWNWGI